MKSISIASALALSIPRHVESVATPFDIAKIAWHLLRVGSVDDLSLKTSKARLDLVTYQRVCRQLLSNGVLQTIAGLPDHSIYALAGADVSDARQIVCAVDPFCYVSHLSAMEYHALTDRLPEMLYVSSPAPSDWRSFALKRVEKELGGDTAAFLECKLPIPVRGRLEKIRGRRLHRFSSNHLGAFRATRAPSFRVSTLGRTFLDMLREPLLCGGIMHVIDAYRDHASSHLRLILDEIDQHGRVIDKMRCGYILEVVCNVRDERIEAWQKNASRGGSRKLDAAAEYSSTFSERWCLSLNVPRPVE